jgi:hypothetical protein
MSNFQENARTLGHQVVKGLVEVALTWATAWPIIFLVVSHIPESWKNCLKDNIVNFYYIAYLVSGLISLLILRPFYYLIANYFVALAHPGGRITREGTNTQIMPKITELFSSWVAAVSLILKTFVIASLLLAYLNDRLEADNIKSKMETLEVRVTTLNKMVGLK